MTIKDKNILLKIISYGNCLGISCELKCPLYTQCHINKNKFDFKRITILAHRMLVLEEILK